MNHEEKSEFTKILENAKQTHNLDLQFSGAFGINEIGKDSCLIAKNRFVITSDGLLIPSFALRMDKEKTMPDPVICLGEVNVITLEDAWKSKILLDARKDSKCTICTSCK
jgi:hypothetical protein